MIKSIALCALLGAAGSAHATVNLILNGDFSTAGGASFGQFASGGTIIDFPTTGGNTDGYGRINNTAGAWGGGLVSPPDADPVNGTPLGDLGLVAGESYTFMMDVITFSGGGTGALKLESWNESGNISATADMPATGTSGIWETYSWNYTIDPAATRIKVVPLLTGVSGGGNSVIGFDNIRVDDTPIVIPPPPLVPNADFETPAGANWFFASSAAQTATFPATGGNPDGHASINQAGFTAGDWAVLVWNNNSFKSLTSLGMTAGETYTFKVDMKAFTGSLVGGVKVDFSPGSTGDIFPTSTIGDGSTWETYCFDITIPVGVTQINFVLVGRPGADVGFDNVEIIIPEPVPLTAAIETTNVVSWTAGSATNIYQPEESADNSVWTALGPEIVGNTVSSVCDADGSPFYRVLESELVPTELLVDTSFELGLGDWDYLGTDVPVEINVTDPGEAGNSHTGDWALRMAADNGAVAAAKTSIAQQTYTGPGSVSPGTSHDFSLWAKVENNVGANMTYSVRWRDVADAVIGQVDGNMNSLPIGVWTEVTALGLVAPAGSDSAFIELGCVTGTDAGQAGSILIDDVSLIGLASSPVATLAATVAPGVEISWPSKSGKDYQVTTSTTLLSPSWAPFGGEVPGTDAVQSVCDTLNITNYYRVEEVAP